MDTTDKGPMMLPRVLYVYWEEDPNGKEGWFMAYAAIDELPDEAYVIGVYHLSELKSLAISKELR